MSLAGLLKLKISELIKCVRRPCYSENILAWYAQNLYIYSASFDEWTKCVWFLQDDGKRLSTLTTVVRNDQKKLLTFLLGEFLYSCIIVLNRVFSCCLLSYAFRKLSTSSTWTPQFIMTTVLCACIIFSPYVLHYVCNLISCAWLQFCMDLTLICSWCVWGSVRKEFALFKPVYTTFIWYTCSWNV